MEWSQNLSVGIAKIDDQHRELINRINGLVAAIKQHICKYTIGDVIAFLEEYIDLHFSEEEQYMMQYRYPEYPQHKAQHEFFRENFSELKKELILLDGGKKPGSYDLSVETNRVVVDWIIDHISGTDKRLGEFLKGRI